VVHSLCWEDGGTRDLSMRGRSGTTDAGDAEAALYLREAGLRATRARVRVLASVLASEHQLTREDIARSFGRRGVDRVTLYRTLLALEGAGLIARHDRAGEAVWCCHAADTGRRLFFVCRRCGSSAKLESGLGGLAKSLGRLAQPAGFSVDSRHIEVTGLCDSCGEGEAR